MINSETILLKNCKDRVESPTVKLFCIELELVSDNVFSIVKVKTNTEHVTWMEMNEMNEMINWMTDWLIDYELSEGKKWNYPIERLKDSKCNGIDSWMSIK